MFYACSRRILPPPGLVTEHPSARFTGDGETNTRTYVQNQTELATPTPFLIAGLLLVLFWLGERAHWRTHKLLRKGTCSDTQAPPPPNPGVIGLLALMRAHGFRFCCVGGRKNGIERSNPPMQASRCCNCYGTAERKHTRVCFFNLFSVGWKAELRPSVSVDLHRCVWTLLPVSGPHRNLSAHLLPGWDLYEAPTPRVVRGGTPSGSFREAVAQVHERKKNNRADCVLSFLAGDQ